MNRITFNLATFVFVSLSGQAAEGSAVNFQDPNDWSVGDPGSSFQEWDADPIDFLGDPDVFLFSTSNTPPSAMNTNPPLCDDPNLGVNSPGFVSSSGGYYSFNGNYSLYAEILNHGGMSGSGGPYNSSHGTRVIVQTAATINEDPNEGGPAGIFAETLELVHLDGSPLIGGENSSAYSITEISDPNLLVDSPFGLVHQQELVFEFWLTSYTGDFRIQTDSIIHSSFQHLRVDTLIVGSSIDADFNGDHSIDGLDLLQWQIDPNTYGGAAGLTAWEVQYGETSSSLSALQAVPEPSALALLFVGWYVAASTRSQARGNENRNQETQHC